MKRLVSLSVIRSFIAVALAIWLCGCGDVYEEQFRKQPGRIMKVEGESAFASPNYQEAFAPYQGQTLHILTLRPDMIGPLIKSRIEENFGIGLEIVPCQNWLDLLLKVSDDFPHDLVFLSDHLLEELRIAEKLLDFNDELIPNLTRLERGGLVEQLSVLFAETAQDYIAPFTWSTLGIALNVDALGGERYPWRLLFDPDAMTPARGRLLTDRMSGVDEPRTMLGTSLISLGYSPNSTNLVEVAKARELLLKQVQFIDRYAGIKTNERMISGDDLVSIEWSGPATVLKQRNPNISFQVPGEGSLVILEAFGVLTKSENPELAQALINYLLEPSVAGTNGSETGMASALRTARPYTDRELITGSAYAFPQPISGAHRLHYLPEAVRAEYLAVYEEVKMALAERKNADDAQLEFLSSLALACTVPDKTRLRAPLDICFSVINDGQTVSKDTLLSVAIPPSIEVVSAQGGTIEEGRIVWDVGSIIAGRFKQVCAQLRGNEIRPITFHATVANRVLEGQKTTCITEIIGIPAVEFEVVDNDPVGVGETVTYEVHLRNGGNGPDSQAIIDFVADERQSIVSAEGPTAAKIEGNRVFFEPIAAVPPQADYRFLITVRAESAGIAHFESHLRTTYKERPISDFESTTQF